MILPEEKAFNGRGAPVHPLRSKRGCGAVLGWKVHDVLRLHWEEAAVEGGERWTGRAVLMVPEGPSDERRVFRVLVTVTPSVGGDGRLSVWSADRPST